MYTQIDVIALAEKLYQEMYSNTPSNYLSAATVDAIKAAEIFYKTLDIYYEEEREDRRNKRDK